MKRTYKSKVNGITLIELLIALCVVGILAVIAVPGYLNTVLKAGRSDAMATLTQDQAILERCYAQTFGYNQACSSMPTFPQTSMQGLYTITISNLTATTYTLTATAIGKQAKDTTCATFTLNQANVKTAANSGNLSQTTCWQR